MPSMWTDAHLNGPDVNRQAALVCNEYPVKYRCAERSNGDTETVNGWSYRFLRHKVQAKPRPPSTHALPESSVNPMSDEDIDRLDVDRDFHGSGSRRTVVGTGGFVSSLRGQVHQEVPNAHLLRQEGVQAWQKEGQAPGRESDQGDTVRRVRGCRSGWFAKSAVLLSRVRLDRKACYQASRRGAGQAQHPANH